MELPKLEQGKTIENLKHFIYLTDEFGVPTDEFVEGFVTNFFDNIIKVSAEEEDKCSNFDFNIDNLESLKKFARTVKEDCIKHGVEYKHRFGAKFYTVIKQAQKDGLIKTQDDLRIYLKVLGKLKDILDDYSEDVDETTDEQLEIISSETENTNENTENNNNESERAETLDVDLSEIVEKLNRIADEIKHSSEDNSNELETIKSNTAIDLSGKELTPAQFREKSIYKDEVNAKILTAISKDSIVTLNGPTGMGKSYIVEDIVRLFKNPFMLRVKATNNFTQGNFIAKDVIVGTKVVKQEGMLLEALDLCENNPDRTVFIVIDEINHTNAEEMLGGVWEFFNKKQTEVLINGKNRKRPDNIKFIFTRNPVDFAVDIDTLASVRRYNLVDIYWEDIDLDKIEHLVNKDMLDVLKEINKEIGSERKEFQIGPSILFDYADKEGSKEIDKQINRLSFVNRVTNHINHIKDSLEAVGIDASDLINKAKDGVKYSFSNDEIDEIYKNL